MNKKGSIEIALLSVIIVLLVAGGVWFYVSQHPMQSATSPSSLVTTPVVPQPSSPSHYSNAKYGFSINLPSDYTFVTGNVSSPGSYLGAMTYTSSLFAVSTSTTVILGGFNVPPDVFASTTTSGAIVGISVNPAISDAATCSKFLDETSAPGPFVPHPQGTLTVNNITYTEAGLGKGAAMSHSEGLTILHTLQHGMCYEISMDEQFAYGYEVMPPNWDDMGALKQYLGEIYYSTPQ